MPKTLYLMMGYPGSGKTTAAKLIKDLTGAVHLWADQERRNMFTQPTYSHAENIKLYNHLNEVAEEILSDGKSVIFDTNFNFYKDREHLRQIAAKQNAETLVIWVQTDKQIAKQRAVDEAHLHSNTRVLGHMPESHFERITNNLEPPKAEEKSIILDGTKIDREYIKSSLQIPAKS